VAGLVVLTAPDRDRRAGPSMSRLTRAEPRSEWAGRPFPCPVSKAMAIDHGSGEMDPSSDHGDWTTRRTMEAFWGDALSAFCTAVESARAVGRGARRVGVYDLSSTTDLNPKEER